MACIAIISEHLPRYLTELRETNYVEYYSNISEVCRRQLAQGLLTHQGKKFDAILIVNASVPEVIDLITSIRIGIKTDPIITCYSNTPILLIGEYPPTINFLQFENIFVFPDRFSPKGTNEKDVHLFKEVESFIDSLKPKHVTAYHPPMGKDAANRMMEKFSELVEPKIKEFIYTKENTRPTDSIEVGDIIAYQPEKSSDVKTHVWIIEAVMSGDVGQESLVGIRSLTHSPGTDHDGKEVPLSWVPRPLILNIPRYKKINDDKKRSN